MVARFVKRFARAGTFLLGGVFGWALRAWTLASPPDEAPALHLLRESEGRRLAVEGLRAVTAGARCLLWHALVEEEGRPCLHWRLKLWDEEAARRFLPVEVPPGFTYVDAWYESRLPEDKARMGEYGNNEVRAGRGYTQEYRCRTASGEIRWLKEDVSVAPLGPGRWRAVGVVTDITDRKQVEEALRESEERFRYLWECNMIGMGRWDGDGSIADANDRLLAILGYSREDLAAGRVRWRNLTPDEFRPLEERAIEEARQYGSVSPYEKEYLRKDGSRIPVIVGGALVNRQPEKGVLFALDLTERKRLEEALRRHADELMAADRRKDEFLAMLAHELRNPLAPISNALHLLRLQGDDSATVDRVQRIVERQLRHLARLTDDLLDVSRLTRGKIRLRRERLDLARLVRETVEDHCGGADASAPAVALETPARPVWVDGDPTRLAQVVGNLLQNARKFSGPDGSIRVDLVEEAGVAALRVSDTGIGIAPEMLPRVFDPFAQADTSLDRGQGGLGLGLALVKGLTELHGGSVAAESAGHGQGARFIVRLPLPSERGSRSAACGVRSRAPDPGLAIRPPRSTRVLVVEDNVDAADSLRELLELSGHAVEVAYSGTEGVDAARRFRPEVVLCDLGLPGMSGYDVAAALRDDPLLRRARLIAVTGYGDEEHRRRAHEAGFDLHLTKPLDLSQLTGLLDP